MQEFVAQRKLCNFIFGSSCDRQTRVRNEIDKHELVMNLNLIDVYFRSMLSNSYVSVRCELETALSWLSTLGGAFSALGDLSINYV